jgi:hypothetical protein
MYHTWTQPFHHSLLSSFSLPGISISIIFPFTYMYTPYLHYIHPPTPFPQLLLPPPGTSPPNRTSSTLLFSDFLKNKNKRKNKITFLFV